MSIINKPQPGTTSFTGGTKQTVSSLSVKQSQYANYGKFFHMKNSSDPNNALTELFSVSENTGRLIVRKNENTYVVDSSSDDYVQGSFYENGFIYVVVSSTAGASLPQGSVAYAEVGDGGVTDATTTGNRFVGYFRGDIMTLDDGNKVISIEFTDQYSDPLV